MNLRQFKLPSGMPARWIAAAAAVASVVALAGAGVWWYQQRHAMPSVADIGSAEAFNLVECKPRLFDGSPAVAVMFTQPLSSRQDWDKLLTATERQASPPASGDESEASKEKPQDASDTGQPVKGRWVLTDNPRVLMLSYATPNHRYQVQVSADIEAAHGARLGSARACEVTAEAMPESFYFASKGIVLPAGQNGGLPVVTVNTPEVDVQFLRVNDDALPRFLEQVAGRPAPRSDEESDEGDDEYQGYRSSQSSLRGTVSTWRLDELRDSTTSVYLSRFTTDARKNRRNVSLLPVEKIKPLQEPGIYIAIMNAPGRFGWDYQVTYFYVTDIGLHIRRHAAQTDVFATSLKSGTAIRGVELSLMDASGKSLAQARTNGDGHAVFTGNSDKARVVVARRGREMSLLALREPALDLSEFQTWGHSSSNQKLFIYAGRDLYRPGETFTVSVLARDADGQTRSAAAAPLSLTLKAPDGSTASTHLVRPHAIGSAYYQQAFELPANAATGRWSLEAKADPGAKRPDQQWFFSVEEFLPERMKLNITAKEGALLDTGTLPLDVEGSYLYGAPASGNRLLGTVVTERAAEALPSEWPDFLFGSVNDDNARTRTEIEETALDDEGKASLNPAFPQGSGQSPLNVRVALSLLESGGRPVVRAVERTWWPAPQLVGLRPLFDRHVAPEGGLAQFELTRVNPQGQFVGANEISVRLVREDRNWYWRYEDGRGWHSGYETSEELVEARSIKLTARTKIALPVRWGRYRIEVNDPSTQIGAVYRFYAGWGAQDADDMGNRPDRVQLKLEGAPFKPGDTAKLTITPPHDGEALVTVEGDRVLWQKRIGVRTRGTPIEIPVDEAWKRHDLYIGVVAFRPGSEGDRVTPARALGLVHLPLSRTSRQLKLKLTAPAKAAPEQNVAVKLKLQDSAGKPLTLQPNSRAMVTVSAVDVGILNITGFSTPDPSNFFFGKHRYGADLLDLYGKLIEKMEGNLAKHRFGGDSGMRESQDTVQKVRLVDLFSGPVALNAQGEATVPLTLPDFNGTLRLMAVASTTDSYASAEAEMTVAAPLVAELSMPRFISPGDSATVALDVSNLSGVKQQVSVKIEAESPLRFSGQQGPITLADKQRTVLRYQVEATDALGLAPIKLTVSAGNIRVVREAALQVQPATPIVRETRRLRIDPGASTKLDASLIEPLWPGSALTSLSISATPPIDVRSAVQGLLMYPYGCLEQTTSSAYPLVFIDEDGAKAFGMKPLPREERASRLDTAFGRLAGMQKSSGGFGLWSSSDSYEGWLSAYVTGFLQDAKQAGFAVPEGMQQRSMAALLEQFQRATSRQETPFKDAAKDIPRDAQGRITDSYVLERMRRAHLAFAEAAHQGYMLAREEKAPLATLRTLLDTYQSNARSPLPLIHLGIALKLMGDEARASRALEAAMALPYGLQPQLAEGSGHWSEWLGDYGSRIRDHALAYALLYRHQIAHPRRENLLMDLAAEFDKRQYYSTQERLALFLAARAAGMGSAGGAPAWKAKLQLNDRAQALSGTSGAIRALDTAQLRKGVSIANEGEQPLYIEYSAEGYPLRPLPPRDDRIVIERSWFTTDGKPTSARQFKTGEMLIVRLQVKAKQPIKDGLVVDRIPAGLEIENLNLSQGVQANEFTVDGQNVASVMNNNRIKHTEYRDDRFVAAAELSGETLTLYYLARVVTPGRFVVPAPFAEDMYRPEIRGVGKAESDLVVVAK
jgi:uncharacterized protein YfaS (alpha-2-macroglobulin family)